MNHSEFLCIDFETGSKNCQTCEPIQIAAVHIDPRRLVLGDTFNSLMRPLEPDKLEDEALKINKKTKEELAVAPHPRDVWEQFTTFVNKFNTKGTSFGAPIPCGYNILGYDMIIVQRMCEKYGPIGKTGKQDLFSNFMSFDLMFDIFRWFESRRDLPNMKLDTVRTFMGMDNSNAHDALQDVIDTSNIIIKYLRLYRNLTHKIPFKDCFNDRLAPV